MNVDVSLLLSTNKPGKDKEDNIVWYPEPYYATVSKNGTEINGTFRSVNCTRISENNTFGIRDVCTHCSKISESLCFHRRAERLWKRNQLPDPQTGLRYEDMTFDELLKKSRELLEVKDKLTSQLYLKKCEVASLKVRRHSLKSKIIQLVGEDDFKGVGVKLVQAYNEGKMSDKNVLSDCLKSVSKNLFVRGKERREEIQRNINGFLSWMLNNGGPTSCRIHECKFVWSSH